MVHERQHQEDGLEVNFATNTLGAADSTFPSEERAHISVMWSRHMSCAVLFQEHTFSRPSWFLFWKRANLHVWWELDMAMRGGEGKERGEKGEGRENGGEGRRGEGGEEGRGRRMGGSSVQLPLQFPLFLTALIVTLIALHVILFVTWHVTCQSYVVPSCRSHGCHM